MPSAISASPSPRAIRRNSGCSARGRRISARSRKVGTDFRRRSRAKQNLERDDDSKRNHPALKRRLGAPRADDAKGGCAMLTTMEGGCHCGRVRFRVTAELASVVDCNCSICTKKGILHLIVPPERFELISGKDDLTTYEFN